MTHVTMYCTHYCPRCLLAERLLRNKGASVHKLRVDLQPRLRFQMEKTTGRHTVPQIFIGKKHIGDYDDLLSLNQSGHLESMLDTNP